MSKKQLPLGTSDFKSLLDENMYYVDKSPLIAEIIHGARVTLLPRPRRFGKTLNMSMLSYFFSNAQDYSYLFDGLAIAKNANAMTHCGKYPVVFLSFKDVKSQSAQGCFDHIKQLMVELFLRHDYLLTSNLLKPAEVQLFERVLSQKASIEQFSHGLKFLSLLLHRYHQQPVVIIIDEYDMPINSAYTYGYYDELVGFLRNVLSGAFKDNSSVFKGVMTGILRIARESIFSGLNNIDVCSLTSSDFNQGFGFTEVETEQLLTDYELSDKLPEVRAWYNGYNFGDVTIYNPWSILHFAKKKGSLAPYWLNTSDKALVRDLIAKAPYELKQELELLINDNHKVVRKPLNEHVVFRDIHVSEDAIWNFLLFSGYLAYKNKALQGKRIYADFFIPNMEVASFYETAILEWFEQGIDRPQQLSTILRALLNEELEEFSEAFEPFVKYSFSYFDVSGKSPESFYHAFVLGMLVELQQTHSIKSNRESGLGRYDVCLTPFDKNQPAFVFEFKKVSQRRKESLENACEAALLQIEEKQYVLELKGAGFETVYPIAIAFEGKNALVQFIR